MDQRKEQLLRAITEEYIRSAEPVSSAHLVERYGFDWSSATVRNEMLAMEEEGYLAQPHTSAGRIPTERGIRYYLDHLAEAQTIGAAARRTLDGIRKRHPDAGELYLKELARTVADLANLAVIVGFTRSSIYYTGLTNVLRQPEFAEQSTFTTIAEVVDHLDQTLDACYERISDDIQVLVGRDNPFARTLGTVITRYRWGDATDGVFGILGPIRMDYPRARALVQFTTQELLTA